MPRSDLKALFSKDNTSFVLVDENGHRYLAKAKRRQGRLFILLLKRIAFLQNTSSKWSKGVSAVHLQPRELDTTDFAGWLRDMWSKVPTGEPQRLLDLYELDFQNERDESRKLGDKYDDVVTRRRLFGGLLAPSHTGSDGHQWYYLECDIEAETCTDDRLFVTNLETAGEVASFTIPGGITSGRTSLSFAVPDAAHEVVPSVLYLLLLDRFLEGPWGRSLANLAPAYGHKEDPASITVSYWALTALKSLFPDQDLPEIDDFRAFLLAGRTTDGGGVGIRRTVTTPVAPPKYRIVENRRHTAVAADFYQRYGNRPDKADDCIRYLTRHRHKGGWSDIDEDDETNDPLTTASVLRVLIDFEAAGWLQRILLGQQHFLSTYRRDAMLWLYGDLLDGDHWWTYKSKERVVTYTVDTLRMVPEFPTEGSEFSDAHATTMQNLADLYRNSDLGLPSGLEQGQPDLSPTAHFVIACCQCRDRYPEMYAEFVPRFLESLSPLLESGNSYASGWALTLSFLSSIQPNLRPNAKVLDETRSLVQQSWKSFRSGDDRKLKLILSRFPDWVRPIALERILPIDLTLH